jgi:hypothetical protein
MKTIDCNDKPYLVIPDYQLSKSCEVMFYLYLPLKMKGDAVQDALDKNLEPRLKQFQYLIENSLSDFELNFDHLDNYYIYLSLKKLYVQPGYAGNRPGFHCDGFKTNDINYIWSDRDPTVFNSSDFSNIPYDHTLSMIEYEKRAKKENNYTLGVGDLIRITPTVVHDVPEITKPGFRTFFKLSISDKKYNLKGNSHNYLIDYTWKMYTRAETRNTEEFANTDYGPQE